MKYGSLVTIAAKEGSPDYQKKRPGGRHDISVNVTNAVY